MASTGGRAVRDHPRIRGEHKCGSREKTTRPGSSPHTRGAHLQQPQGARTERIIPAYAGSTISIPASPTPEPDHPRIRGEHLRGFLEVPGYGGSSPHTRGAHPQQPWSPVHERIIPAYAGSTSRSSGRSSPAGDHPRIRGEHTAALIGPAIAGGSSPHTRGALGARRPGPRPPRIIPAYAGSTDCFWMRESVAADHPRIRGEHLPGISATQPTTGSSPHTRGARDGGDADLEDQRIIPAYAGSTLFSRDAIHHTRDHPRIRGEHLTKSKNGLANCGSSPHTRGAPGFGAVVDPEGGIIPAYAGSTTTSGGKPKSGSGSSPHTRGALDCRPEGRVLMGIIPAYAGSTFFSRVRIVNLRDHPRIRGEHAHPRGSCFH